MKATLRSSRTQPVIESTTRTHSLNSPSAAPTQEPLGPGEPGLGLLPELSDGFLPEFDLLSPSSERLPEVPLANIQNLILSQALSPDRAHSVLEEELNLHCPTSPQPTPTGTDEGMAFTTTESYATHVMQGEPAGSSSEHKVGDPLQGDPGDVKTLLRTMQQRMDVVATAVTQTIDHASQANQYLLNLKPMLTRCAGLVQSAAHVDPDEKKRLVAQRVELEGARQRFEAERKKFANQQAAAAVKEKKRQADNKALLAEYTKLNSAKVELAKATEQQEARQRQLDTKAQLIEKNLANVEKREAAVRTKEKMRTSLKLLLNQFNSMDDDSEDDEDDLDMEPLTGPTRRAAPKRKRSNASSSAGTTKSKKRVVRRTTKT